MGSKIEQRGKKGTWWYIGHFNGRQFRESLKTTDKHVAKREQRLRDVRYSDPATQPTRKRNPSVEEFWALYSDWAGRNRRPHTLKIQAMFWKEFMRFTGAERMGRSGWSRQTVNNCLKDNKAIWNRGIREGWLSGPNPVVTVERFDIPRRKPTFHTEEELLRLLEVAEGKGRNLYWAVLLMGWAGLRKNEMVHLRWDNLDFNPNAPIIRIRATDDFHIKTNEERDVPMHRRIYDALRPHANEEGYVFESGQPSEGKHRYRFDPRRSLRHALKEAGLGAEDPFQKLRRTFGSLLAQRGVSLFKIAKWMGHGVQVCEKHYAVCLAFNRSCSIHAASLHSYR